MNYKMGMDIGKKKCDVCVINGRSGVLEGRQYPNTIKAPGSLPDRWYQRDRQS